MSFVVEGLLDGITPAYHYLTIFLALPHQGAVQQHTLHAFKCSPCLAEQVLAFILFLFQKSRSMSVPIRLPVRHHALFRPSHHDKIRLINKDESLRVSMLIRMFWNPAPALWA
jgi:hypothetical protein